MFHGKSWRQAISTNTNSFLISVSGVLWCGAFPGWITYLTRYKTNIFTLSHCKFSFAYFFTRHYSSAILTIMCVEKFFALYFPLLTKRLCSVDNCSFIYCIRISMIFCFKSYYQGRCYSMLACSWSAWTCL